MVIILLLAHLLFWSFMVVSSLEIVVFDLIPLMVTHQYGRYYISLVTRTRGILTAVG